MTSLLETIAECNDSLRASEQKVADFILTDPARAVELNMTGVANAASVSEPTVMRFCNAIGFDGFRSFKVALIRALALGQPSAVSTIGPGDSVAEMTEKIFNYTISGIDRARTLLDSSSIERSIDLIVKAKELVCVGAGSSGIVALDAQQKFSLFGVPCQAPLDFQQQFIAATFSNSESVIIAISNSGRSKTIIEVAEAARQVGAKVISITGDGGPLTKLADVDIRASTYEDTEAFIPTVSRLASLVIIDLLTTGFALRTSRPHSVQVEHIKDKLWTTLP